MTLNDLLEKGYFPKELPPCFTTVDFASKFFQIKTDLAANDTTAINELYAPIRANRRLTPARKTEEEVKAKRIFDNRLNFSDPVNYTIPKPNFARNTIKIPNPLHLGKLAEVLVSNYASIETLFAGSGLSTTKPKVETEMGEGKRAVRHDSFANFKEKCILKSFNFQIQLKTDIAKFYSSIYTHSVGWAAFGSKDRFKLNRELHNRDPAKQGKTYGEDIDDRLMWCQGQQTMGIPIGPDTSLIVSEMIACHLDRLLEDRLKKRKIDWVGFRYYDDYMMYFHSELDAQIALTELRTILSSFELRINDEKTVISPSSNELERDWARTLKSFFFRPSLSDQKEDIWNFFSLAFTYAKQYPKESVLKLALNKFTFVRIEKNNWDFFESLLFRLGLTDSSSLNKLSKILVSYKTLVNKNKLKTFCFEIIHRNFDKNNDYELSWALWLLKDFELQPTKEIYTLAFRSKSVCASLIALDLINQNVVIKTFDYSDVSDMIITENLNKHYWLLVYECVLKRWIYFIPNKIIDNHFYFKTLRANKVSFYDQTRSLEPLTIETSYFDKIERKIVQVDRYMQKSKFKDESIKAKIKTLFNLLQLETKGNQLEREQIQAKLQESEELIKDILINLEDAKAKKASFDDKRVYFVLGKRFEELDQLTAKEINQQSKEDKDLLFDPEYE